MTQMTEDEFIKKYCIWCDIEDYDSANWGSKCYGYERCFARWGNKDE